MISIDVTSIVSILIALIAVWQSNRANKFSKEALEHAKKQEEQADIPKFLISDSVMGSLCSGGKVEWVEPSFILINSGEALQINKAYLIVDGCNKKEIVSSIFLSTGQGVTIRSHIQGEELVRAIDARDLQGKCNFSIEIYCLSPKSRQEKVITLPVGVWNQDGTYKAVPSKPL